MFPKIWSLNRLCFVHPIDSWVRFISCSDWFSSQVYFMTFGTFPRFNFMLGDVKSCQIILDLCCCCSSWSKSWRMKCKRESEKEIEKKREKRKRMKKRKKRKRDKRSIKLTPSLTWDRRLSPLTLSMSSAGTCSRNKSEFSPEGEEAEPSSGTWRKEDLFPVGRHFPWSVIWPMTMDDSKHRVKNKRIEVLFISVDFRT